MFILQKKGMNQISWQIHFYIKSDCKNKKNHIVQNGKKNVYGGKREE